MALDRRKPIALRWPSSWMYPRRGKRTPTRIVRLQVGGLAALLAMVRVAEIEGGLQGHWPGTDRPGQVVGKAPAGRPAGGVGRSPRARPRESRVFQGPAGGQITPGRDRTEKVPDCPGNLNDRP